MKDLSDSTVPFIIGLAAGFLIAAVSLASIIGDTTNKILDRACGSCDQRAETCGDFTCTKDGWK